MSKDPQTQDQQGKTAAGKAPSTRAIIDFVQQYKVTDGKGFKLSDYDPGDTAHLGNQSKEEARDLLQKGIEKLSAMQEKLYAQDDWAALLIFQAMDAAGKDGTIKHVMSGINPQGCQVYSFKQPSSEELDHDFLWRCQKCVPERGRIGIFNRSYYEDVLVPRVHQSILTSQRLPKKLIKRDIFEHRLQDIRWYESYLARQGIVSAKFYLNLSLDEQKKRFLSRLDEKEKNWKFAPSDLHERQYWDDYMRAYEATIRATATPESPWYIVPADNKWFTRLVVVAAAVETLEGLDLSFPTVSDEQLEMLAQARITLTGADNVDEEPALEEKAAKKDKKPKKEKAKDKKKKK